MPGCHCNEVIWFPGNWLFSLCYGCRTDPVHTGGVGRNKACTWYGSTLHLKWLMAPACSPVSTSERKGFFFLLHLQNFPQLFLIQKTILNSPLSFWGRCKTGHSKKGAVQFVGWSWWFVTHFRSKLLLIQVSYNTYSGVVHLFCLI